MKLIEAGRIREGLPYTQQNFLLIDGGAIVGQPMAMEIAEQGQLELAIFTPPRYRRKGYATAGLRLLIAWAVKNGYKKVTLTDLYGTGAIEKIARKLGFTQRQGSFPVVWDKCLDGPLYL